MENELFHKFSIFSSKPSMESQNIFDDMNLCFFYEDHLDDLLNTEHYINEYDNPDIHVCKRPNPPELNNNIHIKRPRSDLSLTNDHEGAAYECAEEVIAIDLCISNGQGNNSQYRYSGTENNSVDVLSQRDTLQLQRNNSFLLQPNIEISNKSRLLCLTKEAATNELENSTISTGLKNNCNVIRTAQDLRREFKNFCCSLKPHDLDGFETQELAKFTCYCYFAVQNGILIAPQKSIGLKDKDTLENFKVFSLKCLRCNRRVYGAKYIDNHWEKISFNAHRNIECMSAKQTLLQPTEGKSKLEREIYPYIEDIIKWFIRLWKKEYGIKLSDRKFKDIITCATSLVLQDNKYGFAATCIGSNRDTYYEITKLVTIDNKDYYPVPMSPLESQSLAQEHLKFIVEKIKKATDKRYIKQRSK